MKKIYLLILLTNILFGQLNFIQVFAQPSNFDCPDIDINHSFAELNSICIDTNCMKLICSLQEVSYDSLMRRDSIKIKYWKKLSGDDYIVADPMWMFDDSWYDSYTDIHEVYDTTYSRQYGFDNSNRIIMSRDFLLKGQWHCIEFIEYRKDTAIYYKYEINTKTPDQIVIIIYHSDKLHKITNWNYSLSTVTTYEYAGDSTIIVKDKASEDLYSNIYTVFLNSNKTVSSVWQVIPAQYCTKNKNSCKKIFDSSKHSIKTPFWFRFAF